MIQKLMTYIHKDREIVSQAKKNKEIVHGARAMNRQLAFGFMERQTGDWDLFSSSPRKSATMLEKNLDRKSKDDVYYVKGGEHRGTFKVRHEGFDNKAGTEDDFTIADYTKTPRGIKKVRIDGLFYRDIDDIKKSKESILKQKEFKYRHEKDRMDVELMNQNVKLKKNWRF